MSTMPFVGIKSAIKGLMPNFSARLYSRHLGLQAILSCHLIRQNCKLLTVG